VFCVVVVNGVVVVGCGVGGVVVVVCVDVSVVVVVVVVDVVCMFVDDGVAGVVGVAL